MNLGQFIGIIFLVSVWGVGIIEEIKSSKREVIEKMNDVEDNIKEYFIDR